MASRTKVTLDLPVGRIKVHPKNPRRDAVADDQLVASVAESGITTPLLVAVDLSKHTAADVLDHALGIRSLTTGAPYVVALDGHRRRDAARKAKLKTVPVVIDLGLDSDTEQIKAMLLANTLREGLSPIEVAESYQGLLDLGLKQADIAKSMGRKPTEVSRQLKVLKLADTTKAKIHAGTLSLDDAAGLLEFAGDPETTKTLEAAAESGTDFRYQLQRARQRRDAEQETAAEIAALEQAGVPRVEWAVWTKAPWNEMRAISQATGANGPNPPEHTTCRGYIVAEASTHQPSRVVEICTDIASHLAEAATADEADSSQRAAELEERYREAREREAARAAAAKVRLDTGRDLAGQDLKLSAPLETLLRGLLPALWQVLDETDTLQTYEDLAAVPEATAVHHVYGEARDRLIVDHVTRFADLPKASLGRHLTAMLIALADRELTACIHGADDVQRVVVSPFVELLEGAGYDFAGPDAELKAALDHQADDQDDDQDDDQADEAAGPDDVEGAPS